MLIQTHDQIGDGKHRVAAQPARNRPGVSGFTDALHIVVAQVATNAGNHGDRNLVRDHDRPLLDVQFEVGANLRRIEQHSLLANRGDVGTGVLHGRGQRFALAAAGEGEIVCFQFAEQCAGTDIGLAESGAFLPTEGGDLEWNR